MNKTMGRRKKVIDVNIENMATKEEKKVSAEMYADIKGLDARKRFVLKELFGKELHTIKEWNKIIIKKQI